jgi:hypothetical protein
VSLETRVHRVPAEDVREWPDVVVDEPDSPRAVADRFRDPHPGRPAALLVRVASMNSPDRIAVLAARRQGRRVELEVELRAFAGPLFANIVTVAVIEVWPIEPAPGPAEVALVLHTLPFEDIDRPGDAGPPSTSTTVMPFVL